MADKVKLVPVKLTANISLGGKIRKKGETVELPEDQAKLVIEGKHGDEAPKEAPKK